MRKIKNYIFYRTYIEYLKKNDTPVLKSALYLSCIELVLAFPILGFILELFRHDKVHYGELLYLLGVILFALNLKHYFKDDNLKNIITINKNNKYNKKISKWIIYSIFPLSAILGIVSYFFIVLNLTEKFKLEGILYKLLF